MPPIDTYRRWAEQHSLLLFFQPRWLDLVAKKWDVVIVEKGGKLLAAWPYVLEKKATVSIIRNPPMTPYLGPVFFTDSIDKKSLLEQLWSGLPKWDFMEVQCLPGFEEKDFFIAKGLECRQRRTYIFPLDEDEEQLFRRIKDSRRSLIRKAERELTISDASGDVEQFYNMHHHLFDQKEKKYPFTKKRFTDIAKQAPLNGFGLMNKVTDDAVKAMSLMVYDDQQMYLLLTATGIESEHPGGVSLLIWEAIRNAKRMGLKSFDFEGSMDPGIATFFRSFRGTETHYYSFSANNSLLWKLKRKLLG